MACVAIGCKSHMGVLSENNTKISFHRFPKEPRVRNKWIRNLGRDNWTPSRYSRLCSLHFVENCYREGFNTRTLRSDAVPTIFSTNFLQQMVRNYNRKKEVKYSQENLLKAVEDVRNNILNSYKAAKIYGIPRSTLDGRLRGSRRVKKSYRGRPTVFTEDIETKLTGYIVEKAGSPSKNVPKNVADDESTEKTRHSSVRLRNRKAHLANRRCSVPQCNSKPSNEVSLHPCPNNAAVRNEWAEALKVSYQYVKTMVACSLHFMKIDFIQSKNAERVLKHIAVPSRNLPHSKKRPVTVKDKPMKKVATEDSERQKTMTDTVGEGLLVKGGIHRECRACLAKLDDKKSCCDVFQAWCPPWDGMEATIAEDLAKLANVEISITDRHSKVLCLPCYQRLLDAATFALHVRRTDLLLRMRFTSEIDMEKVWPKPIQVDKNISGSVFNNSMNVEIKQEVVSDEEYPINGTDNAYVENELAKMDIKIEPEEFVEPRPMNITINGTISLNPLNSENKDLTNGTDLHPEPQYLEQSVKQEPMSDGDDGGQETEQAPDLSLDCLLCTKAFNSVTGLKAHVIAHHSYKTVKRKTDGNDSSQRKRGLVSHECAICRRNFQTQTDLMVHETCHNKHVCYGCTQKFDSFRQLSRHRKWCKPCVSNSVQKLITLKDVTRLQDEKVEYLEPEILNKQSDETNQEDCEIHEVKREIVESELEEANEISVMKEVINKKEDKGEKNQAESIAKCENTKVECKKEKLDCENKEVGCEKQVKCVNEEAECDKKETESIDKDTQSEKKQIGMNSNMKLLLEFISSNRESEPALDDVDMQVETLENDECT